MPAKNSIKIYQQDGYYHVYNRGVEKRNIFIDQQDYGTFLSYLKEYLLPKDVDGLNNVLRSPGSTYQQKQKAAKALRMNNFSDNIELLTYALLPNHFHLLIKQKTQMAMDSFLNSLGTRYTMYFNRRDGRVGKLYQGVYKAVRVETDEQLLHLSRYIHLNSLKILNLNPQQWQKATFPSSLADYLGVKNTQWLKADVILRYFNRSNPQNSYSAFMNVPEDSTPIAPLALDFEEDNI